MKKILIVAALFASCITHTQAGIPVFVDFDATAARNQITNYAQMLKEYSTMLDQLEQMRSQFEQMEKEYESVTGVRNLGDILNAPEFKEYLPDNWQSVYQGVRNNGYSGLSDSAKAIRDSTKIFDACAELVNDTEKQICNAQAVKPAQDQAFSMDAYQKSQDRVSQIESLMQEINNTRDPKAVAEINARIQAEQAMIGNEQAKLALYQASAESEQRILIQQEEEAHKKRFTSDDYGSQISPMEFN